MKRIGLLLTFHLMMKQVSLHVLSKNFCDGCEMRNGHEKLSTYCSFCIMHCLWKGYTSPPMAKTYLHVNPSVINFCSDIYNYP